MTARCVPSWMRRWRRGAPLVKIIPGKGSGALKKRVLRFLDQKEVRVLYHRVEKDSDNFGRDLRALPLEDRPGSPLTTADTRSPPSQV